jgi:hypothetical protein
LVSEPARLTLAMAAGAEAASMIEALAIEGTNLFWAGQVVGVAVIRMAAAANAVTAPSRDDAVLRSIFWFSDFTGSCPS